MAKKRSSGEEVRRPRRVGPKKTCRLSADVGGLSTKMALCLEDGEPILDHVATFSTPLRGGPPAFLEAVKKAGSGLLGRHDMSWGNVEFIGFGIPGPVDPAIGHVFKCPNLGDGWSDVSLGAMAKDTLGAPALIGNDAKVATLGELARGYGRDHWAIACATLGTGLGGGFGWRKNDGTYHLWVGAHRMGCEFGHIPVLPRILGSVNILGTPYPEPQPCGCKRTGCAEALIAAGNETSPGGIEAIVSHVLGSGRVTTKLAAPWATTPVAKHVALIHELAEEGDEFCLQVILFQAYCIALLLRSVQCGFDASALVLLGGMTKSGSKFLENIRQYYGALHVPFPLTPEQRNVPVLFGKTGSNAGVVGGFFLDRVVYEPNQN